MQSPVWQPRKFNPLRRVAVGLLSLLIGISCPAAEAELPSISSVDFSQAPGGTGTARVKVSTSSPRTGKFSKGEHQSTEILTVAASSIGKLGASEDRWNPILEGAEFAKISLVGGALPDPLDLTQPLIYQFRYHSKDGSTALSEPGLWMPKTAPTGSTNSPAASANVGVAQMVILKTTELEKELSANHLSLKHKALFAAYENSATVVKIALPGPELSLQKRIASDPVIWIGECSGGLLAITRSQTAPRTNTARMLDPVTLRQKSSFEITGKLSWTPAASPESPLLFFSTLNAETRTPVIAVVEGASGKLVGQYEILKLIDEMEASSGISSKEFRHDRIDNLVLSPDGRWLYANTGHVMCFRVSGARLVFSGLGPHNTRAMGQFSEDGSMFVAKNQNSSSWTVFGNGAALKPLAEIVSKEPFFGFHPRLELLLCFGRSSSGFFTPGGVRVAAIDLLGMENRCDKAWGFAAGERYLVTARKKLVLVKFELPSSN